MFNFNLFKNDNKVEGDNQPLYRNAKIVSDEDIVIKAGVPYEGALWVKKETKTGKPADFVSLSLKIRFFYARLCPGPVHMRLFRPRVIYSIAKEFDTVKPDGDERYYNDA